MTKIFCERLKALRIDKKLSQPELAQLVGVSNGMISFWENSVNEPTISNLIKLCQILEVSADYLLGLED
jgi:transcriptional regulator with XRE-family HTH domain